MTTQTLTTEWQGIAIQIIYNPVYSSVFRKSYGYPLVRLEIASIDHSPLPVSDTGYLSHFCGTEDIAEYGGPEAFVLKWLDYEAAQPAWKHKKDQDRQLSLF